MLTHSNHRSTTATHSIATHTHSTDYQSVNTAIDADTLSTLQEEATAINNRVTLNYGTYKPQIATRIKQKGGQFMPPF